MSEGGASGGIIWVTNKEVSTGTWHHVTVFRRLSDNKIRGYIDGRYQDGGVQTFIGNFPPTTNLFFGKGGGGYFDGLLDEVRIYKKSLTVRQIQEHYAEGLKKRGDVVLLNNVQ